SIIHKADPRIKTVLLLTIVILFFFPLSITAMAAISFLLLLTGINSLGFSRSLQPIKMILPIIIFVILLTPPFFRGGNPVLVIKDIIILTGEGLEQTLRLIFRFSGITLCFYIFFSTTSINYFILTLNWFHLPFKAALVITIALRYIPYMIIIYNNIKDAHKLRGYDYRQKKLWKKLNSIFPTLVSVLIQSIKSIPTLSMALELRGIGLETKRSQFNYIKSNRMILQITIASVIVLLAIITVILL
ncbi:MAG: energy-coupling factor transporter transmembrane protein EcfT, partial [Spirochaetales bacterium]|nr:energy-coupling factor transporter transmembrane protein EcfT [Spirochaetales bacterium]